MEVLRAIREVKEKGEYYKIFTIGEMTFIINKNYYITNIIVKKM